MSDMEDIQRRQRNIVAKRILSDGDEEYKINCICTLLESQEELASLREQLEVLTDKLRFADKNCELLRGHRDELQNQLKQKEDENRELLDSISQLIYAMNTTGLPWNTDSTAEKAYANCRSLLKKHIG